MDRSVATGLAASTLVRPADAKKVVYVLVPSRRAPTVLRWSFLLFICGIVFEYVGGGFMDGSLSLAKGAGFLFMFCCLVNTKRCFLYRPRAMWWFLAYVAVFSLNGFFIPDEMIGGLLIGLFTWGQLIVVLWVASNLLQEVKLARSTLLTFSIASDLLALGTLFHIPGFTIVGSEGRMTAFGYNPNSLALIMAIATLMLIGLLLDKSVRHLRYKIVLAVLTSPLLALIVYSGSRAGLGAFIVGGLLYLLPYRRARRKITTILWALLFLGAAVYTAVGDPNSSSRWQDTYEKGDTAGRDRIYSAAIDMILEQPVFGWQPMVSFYELGSRLNMRGRDPHNLFLALLIEVGVVGTLPFLVGLCLCTHAAWKARLGPFGLLPLALLGTILAASMTHSGLTNKSMWLVFAFALAAVPTAASKAGGWSRVRVEASLPG